MLPTIKLSTINEASVFAPLSYEDSGRVYKAMLLYAMAGVEPDFDGAVADVWAEVKANLDTQIAKYNSMRTQNKLNVTSRYTTCTTDRSTTRNLESDKENEKERTKEKDKEKEREKEKHSLQSEKKSRVFSPPTVAEVQSYCDERNNGIDAQAFVDWYTAKDWYIGKNRMRDWRAAVRTWERNTPSRPQKNQALKYPQSHIDEDAFNKLIVDLS